MAENKPAKKRVVKGTSKPAAKTNVADPNLHAYVPSKNIAAKYVGREVWGVWDKTIAEVAIAEKKNILLMGDTGSGKTLFGEAFASLTGRMYYSLACDVSIDPSALFGRMQPTETPGKFVWQDGPVTQVVRNGGVLNISEVNMMTPKIAASLYPLLDNRRYIPLLGHEGEVVRAHDDLLIIADMNPNYRGTIELNAAFKNRFDFKIPWGYEDHVEERLVMFPTIREIANQIRKMHGTEIMTPVSTNMMMEFESFATNKSLGLEFAIHNFLAAFDVDERDSVSKIFELNKSKLHKDISYFNSASNKKSGQDDSDDDIEEIEYEMEYE